MQPHFRTSVLLLLRQDSHSLLTNTVQQARRGRKTPSFLSCPSAFFVSAWFHLPPVVPPLESARFALPSGRFSHAAMHKISSVRHGWEKMTPSMGFGSQRQTQQATDQPGAATPPKPRPDAVPTHRQAGQRNSPLSLSFNVPFSSTLAGPEPDDVIHATPGGFARWIHPIGAEEGTPVHKLPVHAGNVERLRAMCKLMTDESDGALQASITSSEPRPIPGLQRGPLKALVTNVVLSGEPDLVRRMRSRILNDTPIALVCVRSILSISGC